MKYNKYLILLFTLVLTYFGNAQTVNMNAYVTRNELPGQTTWSGTTINPSPSTIPNYSKVYYSFSSSFNWNYNGVDALSVLDYYGQPESFWLRPTPGRPNRRIVIRVITPGVTVNFNGVVLTYEGLSSYSLPIGQSFNGTIVFNPVRNAFQQVIFSAVRD